MRAGQRDTTRRTYYYNCMLLFVMMSCRLSPGRQPQSGNAWGRTPSTTSLARRRLIPCLLASQYSCHINCNVYLMSVDGSGRYNAPAESRGQSAPWLSLSPTSDHCKGTSGGLDVERARATHSEHGGNTHQSDVRKRALKLLLLEPCPVSAVY